MRAPSQRGASAVEFALTLPILIVLVGGLLEYSWYIQSLNSVVHATREGVRYAVTFDQDEDPETEAETMVASTLQGQGIDCALTHTCIITATLDTTGTAVVLRVDASVQYIGLATLVPAPSLLVASYTMALEDQS